MKYRMLNQERYIATRLAKNALRRLPGVARLNGAYYARLSGSMHDPEMVSGVLAVHLRALIAGSSRVRGIHACELGPGNSLAQAFLLCLLGAGRVLGVDVRSFATYCDGEIYRSCVDKLDGWFEAGRFPAEVRPVDWRAEIPALLPARARAPILGDRIRYAVTDGRALPVESESLDFVYSCSVLEHVKDPGQAYAEQFRALRPGGLISHVIDVSDHFRPDSFDFLRYSDRLWRAMQSHSGGSINRLRAQDHLDLIEAAGFEIVTLRRRQAEDSPRQLAPRFRRYTSDELRTLALILSARKPTSR
jgi:SAM-dependent methyltransferase